MIVLFPALAGRMEAETKLAAPFGDHMVLQQGMQVPVWGTARPGEKVTVTFRGQIENTVADRSGRWSVSLPPLEASDEGEDLVVKGENTATLSDVLVGEVWLCAGQSNMAWTVSEKGVSVSNAREEIPRANFPLIRQLRIPKSASKEPQKNFQAEWVECSPETVGAYSGVAYFFAKALFEKLNVPVGIINSSYGGTLIEAWMSPGTIDSAPACKPVVERRAETLANWEGITAGYKAEVAAWEQGPKSAEGKPTAPKPRPPIGPNHPNWPSSVYNAMLHPVIPYPVRGIVWYQGEGNAVRAFEYQGLLEAFLSQCRKEWNQPDLPFLVVQLPNFNGENPDVPTWAWLREAQSKAMRLPHTGMVVTIDVGDPKDVHPRNKQPVGERLARLAMQDVYGTGKRQQMGPVLQEMKVEGGEIALTFSSAEGLVLRKNPEFEIAGDDRRFHSADARLEGQKILLSSPGVPRPVAARYAWKNAPEAALFDRTGYPAAPFRTDDWPLTEAGKQAVDGSE